MPKTNPKPHLSWIYLHALAILLVLTNLVTGLRIATVSRPELLWFSALLPQGAMHWVHALSAMGVTTVLLTYVLYLAVFGHPKKVYSTPSARYFRWVAWYGYIVFPIVVVSGWLLYFDSLPLQSFHFYAAWAVMGYFFLHGASYFVRFGLPALQRILVPRAGRLGANLLIASASLCLFAVIWYLASQMHTRTLIVASIPLSEHVTIDGLATEAGWQQAPSHTLNSQGGANFTQGRTRITVRAMENGVDVFFHLTWDDPTQSLKHLPLIKTAGGWQVQENGFYHFDEQTYYEDKLAVLLADTCEWGAAGTARLGPKPLADKPPNWHGKGYHYATDDRVRDLWHWKAVRTNDMLLADDNFIGKPDIERPGSRRYAAGYQLDSRESGNYVMNWQWYRSGQVEPKRLPKQAHQIAPFQSDDDPTVNWLAPWFEYTPYSAAADDYAVGTQLPSVFYSSNQFEGDRADVRARGVWQDGVWSLELARRLDTGSPHDVAIVSGICLWVSAFDQSQIAHTRHNRALRLQLARDL